MSRSIALYRLVRPEKIHKIDHDLIIMEFFYSTKSSRNQIDRPPCISLSLGFSIIIIIIIIVITIIFTMMMMTNVEFEYSFFGSILMRNHFACTTVFSNRIEIVLQFHILGFEQNPIERPVCFSIRTPVGFSHDLFRMCSSDSNKKGRVGNAKFRPR